MAYSRVNYKIHSAGSKNPLSSRHNTLTLKHNILYLSLLQGQYLTDMTPSAPGQKLEKFAVLTYAPDLL